MKESAAVNVDKGTSALNGFEEHIIKLLSTRLAEKIMTILENEPEIVIRQSDLSMEEFTPTNSVIYQRLVEWDKLVRCKDCKFYDPEVKWCSFLGLCSVFNAESFCSYGERRNDE